MFPIVEEIETGQSFRRKGHKDEDLEFNFRNSTFRFPPEKQLSILLNLFFSFEHATSSLPRQKTCAIPRTPLARSWVKIASYKNVM